MISKKKKMNQKVYKNIFRVTVNVHLVVKNTTKIKDGIVTSVNGNLKTQ